MQRSSARPRCLISSEAMTEKRIGVILCCLECVSDWSVYPRRKKVVPRFLRDDVIQVSCCRRSGPWRCPSSGAGWCRRLSCREISLRLSESNADLGEAVPFRRLSLLPPCTSKNIKNNSNSHLRHRRISGKSSTKFVFFDGVARLGSKNVKLESKITFAVASSISENNYHCLHSMKAGISA